MHRRVAIGTVVVLAGCHAGTASAPPPTSPTGRFTIVERAESKPVTALAASGPYLWTGGGAGLRRIERRTGEYEIVGGPGVPGGHDVAALSVDEAGAAWVSTPAAVGRWVIVRRHAALRGARRARPGHRARGRTAGRAGGRLGRWSKGLYWFDGHGWVTVVALRDVAVTTLTLDESGSARLGRHGGARSVSRGGGGGDAPHSGAAVGASGEAIVLDTVVGSAHPASGTRLFAGNARGEARLYAQTGRVSRATAGRGASRSPACCDRAGEAVLLVRAEPRRRPAAPLAVLRTG